VSLEDIFRKSVGDGYPLIYNVIIFHTHKHLEQYLENKNYIRHCQQIDEKISELIKIFDIKLDNPDDIFVLWWSTYLHDIGQRIMENDQRDFSLTHSEDRYNEYTTKLSEYLDLKNGDPVLAPDNKQLALWVLLEDGVVENISIGHTDYIDIDEKQFMCMIDPDNEMYKLKCLLRFAELLVQLDQRNSANCPVFCYKDISSWMQTALKRLYPKKLRNPNSLLCYYDLVNLVNPLFGNINNLLTIKFIKNRNFNTDISRFLYSAYWHQINIEKENMTSAFSRIKIRIEVDDDNKPDPKFSEMCKAFTNDNELQKIFNYCCVQLCGKADNVGIFGNENMKMSDILSNVSGDYLSDIFIEGYNMRKLDEYTFTGLKICDYPNESRNMLIDMSNGHTLSVSIVSGDGRVQLGNPNNLEDMYILLYLYLEFWCNDYRRKYKINSDDIKGWIQEINDSAKQYHGTLDIQMAGKV